MRGLCNLRKCIILVAWASSCSPSTPPATMTTADAQPAIAGCYGELLVRPNMDGMAQSDGFIYWYENTGTFGRPDYSRGKWSRADTKTGVTQQLADLPFRVAEPPLRFDSRYVYFRDVDATTWAQNRISRIPKVGGAIEPVLELPGRCYVPGTECIAGFVIDDSFLYYAANAVNEQHNPSPPSRLYRMTKDGGPAVEIAEFDGVFASDTLTLDGDYVYWATWESIGRVKKTGGTGQKISDGGWISFMLVDERYIYLGMRWEGVAAMDKNTGAPVRPFKEMPPPAVNWVTTSLIQDTDHVYWGGGSENREGLTMADKATGAVHTVVAEGLAMTATDADRIYYVDKAPEDHVAIRWAAKRCVESLATTGPPPPPQ